MARLIKDEPMFEPDIKTSIGSLPIYISDVSKETIQPMNANFGIIEGWPERVRGGKVERYKLIAQRALDIMKEKFESDGGKNEKN